MKVYAFSDVHGRWDLFKKAADLVGEEDLCFYLGDAIDRGPDGMDIVDFLLEHTDNFIYIKGNHENMFVEAMKEYLEICAEEGYDPYDYASRYNFNIADIMFGGDCMALHWHNGGEATFASWIKDKRCDRRYIHALSNLPVFDYINFLEVDGRTHTYDFCHAGCVIEAWEERDEDAALWSRSHFHQKWMDGHTLVHGHTPICHMPKRFVPANHPITEALSYSDDSKINLDCASFYYGYLNVLELNWESEPIIRILH